MIELFKQLVISQFEASLTMLRDGVRLCPAERWEDKIAADTVRQVAYHTLFYADFYLSPTEASFALRELHQRGGDERKPEPGVGLSQGETIAYAALCRQKAVETLAAETAASLEGPSGFSRRKCSRAELHVYNTRHIQHHVGQISSFVRRVADRGVPWTGAGWKD